MVEDHDAREQQEVIDEMSIVQILWNPLVICIIIITMQNVIYQHHHRATDILMRIIILIIIIMLIINDITHLGCCSR